VRFSLPIWSKDGHRLLLASPEKGEKPSSDEVLLLEVADGREIVRRFIPRLMAVARNDNGFLLVQCDEVGRGLTVIDMASGGSVGSLQRDQRIRDVAANKDKAILYVLDEKPSVSVWSLPRLEAVSALNLPPDGQSLGMAQATGVLAFRQTDGAIAFYDMARGEKTNVIPAEEKEQFITFVDEGKYVMTQAEDGRRYIRSWPDLRKRFALDDRTRDYRLDAATDLERRAPIVDFATAPESDLLVTGRADGKIVVWGSGFLLGPGGFGALPELTQYRSFDHGEPFGFRWLWSPPPAISVSARGTHLATQGGGMQLSPTGTVESNEPSRLRVWDVTRGQEVGAFYSAAGFFPVSFDPSGRYLATSPLVTTEASGKTEVQLWEVPKLKDLTESQRIPLPFIEDRDLFIHLTGAKSPLLPTTDGRYLIWFSMAGQIYLWDTQTLKEKEIADLSKLMKELPFGPFVDKGSDTSATRRMPMPLPLLSLSEDGRRLVVALGKHVRVYSIPDGNLIEERQLFQAVLSTAISMDGTHIAVTTGNLADLDPQKPPEEAEKVSYYVTHIWQIGNFNKESIIRTPTTQAGIEMVMTLGPQGKTVALQQIVRPSSTHPYPHFLYRVLDVTTGGTIMEYSPSNSASAQVALIRGSILPPAVFSPNGKLLFIDSTPINISIIPSTSLSLPTAPESQITVLDVSRGSLQRTRNISLASAPRILQVEDSNQRLQIWQIESKEDGKLDLVRYEDSTELETLVGNVCARLPEDHKNFTPSRWELAFPGEPYRQTCEGLKAHKDHIP
jgi:WD40 repeat protein